MSHLISFPWHNQKNGLRRKVSPKHHVGRFTTFCGLPFILGKTLLTAHMLLLHVDTTVNGALQMAQEAPACSKELPEVSLAPGFPQHGTLNSEPEVKVL